MKSITNAVLLVSLVAISTSPTVHGFNVGVKGTKCNLDQSKGEINDPCGSLYDAVCGGKHCSCPPATHEDPSLGRCLPGNAPKTSSGGSQAGPGGGGYDPFDDIIDSYPGAGKKDPAGGPVTPPPVRPAPQPTPPRQPAPQPQPPQQPGYNPNQPGYNPNQPGYNPNQPGYNPNQPGYNPNQPGQPGYNPNQPGYKPGTRPKDDNNVGEKAGGGVGGVIGLLIIGGLIYFCCCKGGKHKEVMNRFSGGRFQGIPFIGGGQQGPHGAPVQMQQSPPMQQDPNFGSQHTYVPPGGGVPTQDPGQYGAPQQPYPPAGGYYPGAPGAPYAQQLGYAPYPPPGFVPDGQQPPPYTPQYQPNAPPPQ